MSSVRRLIVMLVFWVEYSKGPIWNKQFTVFLEALPDWEKLKHLWCSLRDFTPCLAWRRWKKGGNSNIFYFLFPLLTPELKAYLCLHIWFPSLPPMPAIPNISAVVSCVPGGRKGWENRHGRQGIWWLLLQGEKKFIFISLFRSWPKSVCGLSKEFCYFQNKLLTLSW